MIQESQKSLEKDFLLEKDTTNFRIVYIVQSQVQHGDECLLDTGLAVAVHQGLAESTGINCLKNNWE